MNPQSGRRLVDSSCRSRLSLDVGIDVQYAHQAYEEAKEQGTYLQNAVSVARDDRRISARRAAALLMMPPPTSGPDREGARTYVITSRGTLHPSSRGPRGIMMNRMNLLPPANGGIAPRAPSGGRAFLRKPKVWIIIARPLAPLAAPASGTLTNAEPERSVIAIIYPNPVCVLRTCADGGFII